MIAVTLPGLLAYAQAAVVTMLPSLASYLRWMTKPRLEHCPAYQERQRRKARAYARRLLRNPHLRGLRSLRRAARHALRESHASAPRSAWLDARIAEVAGPGGREILLDLLSQEDRDKLWARSGPREREYIEMASARAERAANLANLANQERRLRDEAYEAQAYDEARAGEGDPP